MIEASNLTFGYERGKPILRTWSASVRAGEAVALVGPSGSGKSTLLYVLGALVRPWSGGLRLAGVDVEGLSDRGRSNLRAGAVGFVFQDALLDARRSVLDNVLEGSVYRGDDRRKAAARARSLLEQFGVEVEARRRAVAISGGQAQRVALCRALLNDPCVLLADEPTGNLDVDNGAVVERALFEQARRGATVVIATHDLGLAARCDRILPL